MVRIEKVDPRNPDDGILREAAGMLAGGEVLVCPTDTGYAFGANALDESAIRKVFDLKGRSFNNPIHITVRSIGDARKYAEVGPSAELLMRRLLPGALTVVLKRKPVIPPLLVGGRDTVGIRIPDNKIILALARLSGVPVTSTSANISGRETPYDVGEIIDQLGAAAGKLAMIIDQGALPVRGLSTIVDLTSEPPRLIRAGLIGMEVISQALGLVVEDRQPPE